MMNLTFICVTIMLVNIQFIMAGPCQLPGQGETVLEAGANGLSAGEWCELVNATPDESVIAVYPGQDRMQNMLQYQHGAQWDPVNRLWVVIAYGYGAIRRCGAVVYEEETNTWYTFDNEPVGCDGNGHSYDQTVVDPVTGYVYYTPRMDNAVYRGIWNNSTKRYSWSGSVVTPINNGCLDSKSEEAMGLAWDESRDGIVLFTDAGGGTACFWDRATNIWSRDATGLTVTGSYHHVAEYDPVHQATWMIDWNSKYSYKNDHGTVTGLSTSNPPFNLGCCGSGMSHYTADPGTGDFLVVHATGGTPDWYQFEIDSDTWTDLPDAQYPPVNSGFSGISSCGAPISTHNVLMYLEFGWVDPKVWIYKHSDDNTPIETGLESTKDNIRIQPNPFHSKANIVINSKPWENEKRKLGIYNVRGRLVADFPNARGRSIDWDASHLPTGVYVLKVKIGNKQFLKRLLLQK